MSEHLTNAEHDEPQHEHLAHISPPWMLLATFFSLLLLTGLTVAVTWVNLGPWNLLLALLIATIKAMLVALFFMHLAYDKPINGLYLLVALVFVGLFVGGTLKDTLHYQPEITEYVKSAQ